MKKLTLIILSLTLSTVVFSQRDTIDKKSAVAKPFEKNEAGGYEYTQVYKLDSLKSNQLYKNAKIWFTDFFKSAKDVIQTDDKEAGLIIGKGVSELKGSNYTLYFTIKIEIKEGKYKLTVGQMKIRRPLDAKFDDKNDWTVLVKGETLPIESIFPNEKKKEDLKLLDSVNKSQTWSIIYDIKNTLFEKMKKNDDW